MSARFWTAAEIHPGLDDEFAADKCSHRALPVPVLLAFQSNLKHLTSNISASAAFNSSLNLLPLSFYQKSLNNLLARGQEELIGGPTATFVPVLTITSVTASDIPVLVVCIARDENPSIFLNWPQRGLLQVLAD